ncbi:MAG: ABC transporter substrate-binding protein, partial [Anaerolineales bacterium]
MARSKVSRRDFIRFAGVASGAALLGACAPSVITQTQIVKETEIVNQTQVVNQVQTQVVERLITPTPVPAAMTPQGKEMPADAAPLDKQVWIGETGGDPIFLDASRDIYRSAGANTLSESFLRNNQDFELTPCLAESWKVDDTGKLWQFTIRQGAKWSDDTPVTAD